MGLSGSAKTPAVASASEIAGQAVNANISNLGPILEAFKKYGPEVAAQLLTAAQTLNPTLKPLGDLLGKRIDEVSGGGIPATLKAAYERNFRNSMASRGFVDSPASANEESIGLAALGEEYAQNTIAGALDYGNLLPDSPTLGTLGLENPSLAQQQQVAQEQNISSINMALDKNARKSSMARSLGTGAGMLAGLALAPVTGGSSLALATQAGTYASVGGAVGGGLGGTFF